MGTAANHSTQTSSSNAATPATTEMNQPLYELVITKEVQLVAIPTCEERDDEVAQNKPRIAAGRHLGRPSIAQRLFGWLI